MNEDLTISDVVDDPLIGLLLKADRIPRGAFAQLLESASRIQANRIGDTKSRVSFVSGRMILPHAIELHNPAISGPQA